MTTPVRLPSDVRAKAREAGRLAAWQPGGATLDAAAEVGFAAGEAAGFARAVEALTGALGQMQDAGPLHYFDCARLDPPTHAGATKPCDCLANADLAAARALTETAGAE